MHRILGILVFSGSLLLAWLTMDFRQFADTPLDLPASGIQYTLEPGSSVAKLAGDLESAGILENALYLRLLARWDGLANRLQAGEYHIDTGATPRTLLNQIVKGKVVSHVLMLVDGWTFRQVMAAVNNHQALKHTLESLSDKEIMRRLGHEGEHPEGRFFPDTYHFPYGTTDVAFLLRAYNAMERFIEIEWKMRDSGLPIKTPYEALILASIIERETALPMERPEIAGVFTRRLHKRMRLQTDPTVIYGMGDAFDGNIRRSDLRTHTPYNTYMNQGLTPTPIALPSPDAILAALHPAPGTSLYFVARGDGSHQFSDTLEEHNKAVRKYQLKK
ncbi:FIG004453: protein YceG like [hydrothermal vent metagenome]|uniref:FIG004453: protein YceG like n=1 Tax=hydrothermal vent metagenome TaxID=652676 RepID=A0A3B1BH34_9ZZZZ